MLIAPPPTASKAVLSVALPFRRGGPAAGLPSRIKILGWGENIGRTTGARILVDETVVASLASNQELVACDRVPMDYEHQSVLGHPNYQPDPRYSPGAGIIECVQGEGIFLSAIEYTSNGEELAESYQDVSAVVHLDKNGRPLWVSSVALTQRGDVAGMELAEAVAVLSAQPTHRSNNSPHSNTTPSKSMNTPTDEKTFRSLLIAFLGLKPGESGEVTDEEIIAATEAKTATLAADETEKKAPEAASTAELSAVADLKARLDALDRKNLIDAASREGKVVPLSAEMIEKTPVAVLSALITGLTPGEVNLDNSKSTAREKTTERVVALSADQARAAKALGLTDEEYRTSIS